MGVAPLAGAWIEIRWFESSSLSSDSRSPCGSVDRNFIVPEIMEQRRVAPLAGAWIEIQCRGYSQLRCAGSLPLRERG